MKTLNYPKMILSTLVILFFGISYQVNSQPTNNLCSDATEILCGDNTPGTTIGATTQGYPQDCQAAFELFEAGGVWYKFEGTGDFVVADVCDAFFDTQLAVYSGTCTSLVCVAGNDDFCNVQSQVNFISSIGVTYYIYVTGYSFGDEGPFTISLNCSPPPPPVDNNLCSDAKEISCGDKVSEATIGATNEDAPDDCEDTFDLAVGPGVWYKFNGSDGEVTLNVCEAGFDTQLAVYSGECGQLQCVAGNDDACDLQSIVTFQTQMNQSYFVYVTGYDLDAGLFELEMECDFEVSTTQIPATQHAATILPNPGSGESLTFEITGLEPSNPHLVQVQLFNLNGQLIHRDKISTTGPSVNAKIDMPKPLPSGSYWVHFLIDGKSLPAQSWIVH